MPKAAETVEVAGNTLIHPDRVPWPEPGIAKRILARVANRPLPLER